MTLVDIILPTYNSEKYIEETLNSITNQDFKDWKLIIIDDNSDKEKDKVTILLKKRKEARDSKNWELADKIR